jgi:hypothetical protein
MPEGYAVRGSDIEHMKPHEMLLLLGGFLSIILGLVFFGLGWVQGLSQTQLLSTSRVLILVVDVIVGIFLCFTFLVSKRSMMNAGIMAVVMAIVLMAFGGTPGLIGGVVGLLGGCLAIAMPYLPVKA